MVCGATSEEFPFISSRSPSLFITIASAPKIVMMSSYVLYVWWVLGKAWGQAKGTSLEVFLGSCGFSFVCVLVHVTAVQGF